METKPEMKNRIRDTIRVALFGIIVNQVREDFQLGKGECREDKIQEFALDILEIIRRETSNDNAMEFAEEVSEFFDT